MISAMKEMFLWAQKYKGKMISADQVALKAHMLLEDEKDDIIDAFFNGKHCSEEYESSEVFYNENYNQDK